MSKIKRILVVLATLLLLASTVITPTSALHSYQTYTYSKSGYALYSPDAYTPIMTVDSSYMKLDLAIDNPQDLVVDEEDNIYIADADNNRIVVLNRYYNVKFEIDKFVNEHGISDALANPSGVFIKTLYNDEAKEYEKFIYVCDTDANRIVKFNSEGEYIKIIPAPESALFGDTSVYKPVACAVDDYGRLYVVSSTTYQGVIVMNDDAEFISFIGTQKVAISAWDKIWRALQTDEQRELTASYIATEFNNITIDDEGFVYVTTSSIDANKQQSAIKSKSKSGDFAPVKKLNPSGDEIMKRNGFWPPSGEVQVQTMATDGSVVGASRIIDVAVGPEGTWSIVDEKRQKVFTYDSNGNLLFAFGDSGNQLGNLASIESVCYKSDGTMMILDKTNDNITIYERTDYGDIIIDALANQNNRQYDKAIDDWQEILKRNSNFDVAYVGIGNALYRNGDYSEALGYYESAYATSEWSDAYKEIRKEYISKWLFLYIAIAVAVIVAVMLFFKFAGKVNKRAATAGGKRTFGEELLYGFHLIFHPFDGFWDLKHEKRGSVRAALVYLLVAIIAIYYQEIGSGYLINPEGAYSGPISMALSVLAPLFLWVVGNWCLTTLFDGEGSMKDIFIASCYSLLPLPLLIVPGTLYSNVALSAELDLVSMLTTFAFLWLGALIFVGMMVTHDYSMFKSLVTSLGTIVAMGLIMFIGILFTTLLGKMVSFVTNIIVEINYRMS